MAGGVVSFESATGTTRYWSDNGTALGNLTPITPGGPLEFERATGDSTYFKDAGGGLVPSLLFSILPSIIGMPQVSVPMIFDDGIPPIGYVATGRVLIDATTNAVIASANAPTPLAYTPVSGDLGRVVRYGVTVPVLGTIYSAAVAIASAPVTLGTPALVGSLTQGAAASGVSITGLTAGSDFALNIGGLTVNGTGTTRTVTGTPMSSGALSGTETLAGATNSGKVTALGTIAVAGDGRRTNSTVTYGYGDLTRNGFGAVSLNSDYLGITRAGKEKPVSYSTTNVISGTAAHWNLNTSTTSTPTKKAALTDSTYVFQVVATFADTTTETITLTINRLVGVYTVGTADNLGTVGVTDTAVISGKEVQFAAGCDFHNTAVSGGRKFFQAWRPAAMTTVRPHDLARMGLPPSWVCQSVQNVTFRNMYVCGDLNPVGITACYAFTRNSGDTNNNGNVIFDGHGVVYDKKWYGSSDAGPASGTGSINLKTSGAALPVGTRVIPVLGGTTSAFRVRGVVVGDPITFDGDPTVYRVTADNITYSGTFDDPYVSGGSFTIDQDLAVAISGSAVIRAIAAPNCYAPEYCDDVTMLNGTFQYVQGGITGGTNTNVSFKVKNWKIRHYWNNIIITGTNPPQGYYLEDCSWVSPDRVSKFIHIDAVQVALASLRPLISIKRCEIYQADGTGFFQGLFMRGDNTGAATDGSDAGTFDVDGFIATTGAIALVSMTGGKDSKFKRIMGVPAVGRVVDAPAAWRDVVWANAMSATLSKTTDGREFWSGVSTADRIVMFADYNTNLTPGKLVSTNIKAHGNRLYSLAEAPAGSANFGKVKTSEYVSGGYYDADPVAAIAAVDWSTMTHDQVVAGHRAILKPKLNGAYKLADGSYLTALNPDGSWATDAAYVAP